MLWWCSISNRHLNLKPLARDDACRHNDSNLLLSNDRLKLLTRANARWHLYHEGLHPLSHALQPGGWAGADSRWSRLRSAKHEDIRLYM